MSSSTDRAYDATVYYFVGATFSWVTPNPWWADALLYYVVTMFLVAVFKGAERVRAARDRSSVPEDLPPDVR